MEIAATGKTIWLHESSLISFMGNTRLRYSGLTVSFWVEYVMLCSSMYKPPPMIPLRHKLHTKVFPIILPPPISWWLVKLSISYWFPEEHPYIGDFSRFTAYVRTNLPYARTQRLPPVSHIGGDQVRTKRTWSRKAKGRIPSPWWYPAFARLQFRVVLSQNLLQTKNVPEPFFVKNRVRVRTVWWTVQDSNLWPPARQADALPAELTVHILFCQGQLK